MLSTMGAWSGVQTSIRSEFCTNSCYYKIFGRTTEWNNISSGHYIDNCKNRNIESKLLYMCPKLSLLKKKKKMDARSTWSILYILGDFTSIKRETCANQFLLFVLFFSFFPEYRNKKQFIELYFSRVSIIYFQ